MSILTLISTLDKRSQRDIIIGRLHKEWVVVDHHDW